jgi:hypothetical protein
VAIDSNAGWRAEWSTSKQSSNLSSLAGKGVEIPPITCRNKAGDSERHSMSFKRKGKTVRFNILRLQSC